MTKLIRATMALVSFALCTALYAGSADIYSGNGIIDISIGGTTDGAITIINLDTNQTVAQISALTQYPYNPWGSNYGYYYTYYGTPYVSGSTITQWNSWNGTACTVSGLPAGNYRVTATAWQMADFTANSWGNYAEIALYSPYWGSEWMDFYITGS